MRGVVEAIALRAEGPDGTRSWGPLGTLSHGGAGSTRRARVPIAGAVTSAYDARGRLRAHTRAPRMALPPGGFAIAERTSTAAG